MPSYLRLLRLNFVTAHQRMCHPILNECYGMTVVSPSSLHIVEEHQHCSWKERRSASPATNLVGAGLCDCVYQGVSPSEILAGRDDSSMVIVCHQGALVLLKEDEAKVYANLSQVAVAGLGDSTSKDVSSNS